MQLRVAALRVPPRGPRLRGRHTIGALQAELEARPWARMTAYEMSVDATVAERFHGLGSSHAMVGEGEGFVVRYHEPTLTVHEGRRLLVRAAHPSWSPRITMLGHGCSMLTDLYEAWGSARHRVLAVELHSSGSPHFCPSSAQIRVVRLPP